MICLFIGPMYSSKTTTLLARLERYELGGKKCIIIKYKNDNRYDTDSMVVTHSQYKHDAICAITLADIDHLIDSYDVISIEYLNQIYNVFQHKSFNMEKLSLSYWNRKIMGHFKYPTG